MTHTLENSDEMRERETWARRLEGFLAEQYHGRNQSLEHIIGCIRNGDIKAARAECFVNGDKLDRPELRHFLRNSLFADMEDHPWSTVEKLKGERL